MSKDLVSLSLSNLPPGYRRSPTTYRDHARSFGRKVSGYSLPWGTQPPSPLAQRKFFLFPCRITRNFRRSASQSRNVIDGRKSRITRSHTTVLHLTR